MVTGAYDHIWDCCCDHGLLGAKLLERQAAHCIHFVDIVPSLMAQLETKLQRFYPDSTSQWLTHCIDVAQLPLHKFPGKHLIIIAGVGGDLMASFITSIHRQSPDIEFDFLLCPVHHTFTLRQTLIKFNYQLKSEVLLKDNQRFYEVLHVTGDITDPNPVHPVGCQIWQSKNEHQKAVINQYLQSLLNHYNRIQSGEARQVQHVIQAYNEVASNKA